MCLVKKIGEIQKEKLVLIKIHKYQLKTIQNTGYKYFLLTGTPPGSRIASKFGSMILRFLRLN